MEIIDRYVYAVVKRLPESTRQDVERELRANIQDMLPDNHDETDVQAALTKLGNPYRLAEEYRETKRYLIGPGVYDSYISVLRLVISIVVPVVAGLSLLGAFLETSSAADLVPNLVSIVWKVIATGVEGGVQAALWVTVVFVLLERGGMGTGELPFSQKKWTLDDLPPVPKYITRQIPRHEAILAILGTVLGTGVFTLMPQIIGWYEQQNGRLVLVASLFDTAVLRSYLPGILLVAATGLFVAGLKLAQGHWSLPLAVSNAVHNTLVCILLLAASSNQRLISSVFLSKAQVAVGLEAAKLSAVWARVVWVFVAVAVVAALVDTVSGFYKSSQLARR